MCATVEQTKMYGSPNKSSPLWRQSSVQLRPESSRARRAQKLDVDQGCTFQPNISSVIVHISYSYVLQSLTLALLLEIKKDGSSARARARSAHAIKRERRRFTAGLLTQGGQGGRPVTLWPPCCPLGLAIPTHFPLHLHAIS